LATVRRYTGVFILHAGNSLPRSLTRAGAIAGGGGNSFIPRVNGLVIASFRESFKLMTAVDSFAPVITNRSEDHRGEDERGLSMARFSTTHVRPGGRHAPYLGSAKWRLWRSQRSSLRVLAPVCHEWRIRFAGIRIRPR